MTDRLIASFGWGIFTGFGISAALCQQFFAGMFFALIAVGFGCYVVVRPGDPAA